MKVILYMAIAANGMIARENDSTDWVSDESWDNYLSFLNKYKNVVVGHNTYEIMNTDEFLDECLYVVMTRKDRAENNKRNVLFINQSPQDILTLLESKGYKEIFVGGGSEINAEFMKAGLVDEVILDVQPTILGKGVPLFDDADFEVKLELVKSKKLNENTLQLHYRVKKS